VVATVIFLQDHGLKACAKTMPISQASHLSDSRP
jgi:hypothetical protein